MDSTHVRNALKYVTTVIQNSDFLFIFLLN